MKKSDKIHISNFLNSQNEPFESYKVLSGGNHNRVYNINDKYFFKFKDELAILEESMYFSKYQGKYYPKCYYFDLKNNYIIYELLNAHDAEDATKIENIIDIAFNLSHNSKKTRIKGFGYYGIENPTWISFLKQEVNVSRDYLKKYLDKKDFDIVDRALKTLSKYRIEKRILHGDFGLHNIMVEKSGRMIVIDPEPVLGDWTYDFIFFCLSDKTTIKLISFKKIIERINEPEEKTKAMMIVVMFNRLRRILKYYPEDYNFYLKKWKELEEIY